MSTTDWTVEEVEAGPLPDYRPDADHDDDHQVDVEDDRPENQPIPITRATGKKRKGLAPADLAPDVVILPAPTHPMAVARRLVDDHMDHGMLVLRHWRGGWWNWRGSHWLENEAAAIRKSAYAFTEKAYYLGDDGGAKLWEPTRFKIGNLLEALGAIVHLGETIDQPSWIGVEGAPVVAVANGLLALEGRVLLPHTPAYFNQTAVPFDFDPQSPEPATWLAFLDQLWPDYPDSIDALQEFMGYVISGRLDLHKILLIVGPTRAGKGIIARILGKLIGPDNVAGPTLSSLSYDFGMAPLIGKSLAVISDARLDVRRDTSIVVERLLAISGEDTITVNRKHKDQWTGRLPCRFLVVSNELPQLGDASGTIANRFVVLQLRESWLGREDHTLEDRLTAELTGILNWALDGLDRLALQDRFTRPASTDEAIVALQDLASPVAAFVRDRCVSNPTYEVRIDDLYASWKAWAEVNGNKPGNIQTFGRNLRAVIPGLRAFQSRDGEAVDRYYRGIGLSSTRSGDPRVTSRDDGLDPDPVTRRHAIQTTATGTQEALLDEPGATA